LAGTIGPATYAAWRQTALGRITEAIEHRLILDLAGDVTGKRVLDAGCGDGLLTRSLGERGAHIVGLDADRRMLVAAAARAAGGGVHAEFVEGRLERLPFADNAFDVVVAVTVLCVVSDASVAVREIARVLRPGGRLVIGELGRWSLWAARRRVRGWLGSGLWKAARFRTAARLRALIGDAGLSVGAVRGAVYYPPVGCLARILAPADRSFGRVTTLGAAFIGVAATK
jgi:ubiquinone/menaquinone biosynthesis C-methylase UbiE